MLFTRHFTRQGEDPYQGVRLRSVQGEDWLEYTVPQGWSQQAAEILIHDIFYKDPVPALTCRKAEEGVPAWLCPSIADDTGLDNISAEWRYRFEKDVREVLNRIAGGLAYVLFKAGVAQSAEEAEIFYDEWRYVMIHQIVMPDLALLKKYGLDWAYGFAQAYTPEQSINGIEATAFDSGISVPVTTTQKHILKKIGLIETMRALDEARSAAAVIVPVENCESPDFITSLRETDIDNAAKTLGRRMLRQAMHHVMDACERGSIFGFDPKRNAALSRAIVQAKEAGLEDAAISTAIEYARQGFDVIDIAAENTQDTSSANMLRRVLSVPDHFIESALTGHGFMLYDGGEAKRHVNATKLWDKYGESLWATGGPEIFFRDSARAANPVLESGDFGRSGSGGFVFLNDTAAPAAHLNLCALTGPSFAVKTQDMAQAVALTVLALEAALYYAPEKSKTEAYRPIALGFTGLSTVLMGQGMAYDSEAGCATAALIAAYMTASAQVASAQIAARVGAFDRDGDLRKSVLAGIKQSMAALAGNVAPQKGVTRRPSPLHVALMRDQSLVVATKEICTLAYDLARDQGLRHAHVTMVDISMAVQTLLGAQTHGIAPETQLVRFEGYFADVGDGSAALYGKKLNPAVPVALKNLGYSASDLDDIYFYAVGHGTLLDAPAINHVTLRTKGFHQAALDALEAALSSAQHIRYVFNKWTLGEDFCKSMLGFKENELESGAFDMLAALGFSEDDIEAANIYCCGTLTLEGAPHLQTEHLPVFDCLFSASTFAVRCVSSDAQVRMQAAVEPFLSGAAVQVIEVLHHTVIDDMQKLTLKAWELGVKNLTLYRQGCSLLSPQVPLELQTTDRAESSQSGEKPSSPTEIIEQRSVAHVS